FVRSEVGDEALLTPIPDHEHGRMLATEPITFRRYHLQDARAAVGEQHARQRRADAPGTHLDHLQAFADRAGHRPSPFCRIARARSNATAMTRPSAPSSRSSARHATVPSRDAVVSALATNGPTRPAFTNRVVKC